MNLRAEDLIEKWWCARPIGQDKIKVYYKVHKGNNPKPFILPKNISIDETLAEIAGLYLGDGKLTPKDLLHCDYTSKDLDLTKKMFIFFKSLGVKKSDITFTIDYSNGNPTTMKHKISKYIGKQKFRLQKTDRNRHPSLHLQVNGKIFRIIFERILMGSLEEIKKNSNLRRAFLRGYFAADGWIGYSGSENYITCIGFAYNPKTEEWLRDFCLNCLKLEGINSKIKIRHEQHNGQIIITNWANYYKLWKLCMFEACKRKKQKFVEIFSNMKICCKIEELIRSKLFSGNQYELAKKLGTYQATISNMKTGSKRNMWPTVDQIKKLSEINKIPLTRIKKNITRVRFGNLTIFDANQVLINDVFNLENLSS